jgi:hypothetical protein
MDRKNLENVDLAEDFTAQVKLSGINPYIDAPERVVKAFGDGTKTAVLVRVTIAGPMQEASPPQMKPVLEKDAARLKKIGRLAPGGWFRTTLVPFRAEPTRLYLDTWMREAAGVGVGDSVHVTLKPDHESREIPLPDRLLEMLEASPRAREAWDALAPSRQREILTYLNFLKTPEALERNVQKTIAKLLKQR